MSEEKKGRRGFLGKLIGLLIGAGLLGHFGSYIRSLVPNVRYEPPERFKVGLPADFPEGVKFMEQNRVFVFKERGGFYAISAICTHLGCTIKFSPFSQPQEITVDGEARMADFEFRCPCHGSVFNADGSVNDGPAPGPLAWHPLEVSPEDGQLLVDMSREVDNDFRLVV